MDWVQLMIKFNVQHVTCHNNAYPARPDLFSMTASKPHHLFLQTLTIFLFSMLTRSVIARRRLSTALQAQVYRSPTRQLHVTLPRAQIQQPQGPGFYIQLKFWRPGTPRSRIMGAFVGICRSFILYRPS